jgi:hypothetical protein
MSFSRGFLTLTPEQQAEATQIIARKVLLRGQGRIEFDCRMRPIFSALHRAGESQEIIRDRRRESRRIFALERTRIMPSAQAVATV